MNGPRDHHTKWSKSDKNESRSVVSDSLWPHGLYTVHGILQARIQEWVAFPSSRGSSQHRNQIQVSCIAGRFLPAEPQRKPDKQLTCTSLITWNLKHDTNDQNKNRLTDIENKLLLTKTKEMGWERGIN